MVPPSWLMSKFPVLTPSKASDDSQSISLVDHMDVPFLLELRGYGNVKFQTVLCLTTTLARVIQLSTGAGNGDVDGWTCETA